jgi:hypothetical protein
MTVPFISSFILTARLASQALIRDNWRCIVTDVVQWGAPDDIMDQLDVKQTIIAICTECAHIAPEATFFGMHPELDKNENSKVRSCSFRMSKRAAYV